MRKIKVFVGSPGDLSDERNVVSEVVEGLSRSIAPMLAISLETIKWETHAWPDVGADAQDVINREIGAFDVFVGIMWRRFGTPTKRAESGTGEEFERAYEYFKNYSRPKIMFYFRTSPFYSSDEEDARQFLKVIKFRKQLRKYGVLFWEYKEILDFERRFREHLTKQLLSLQPLPAQQETSNAKPRIFLSYKRQDLARVESVYEALQSEGFLPWMDVHDILPGGRWVDEVEKAINAADFFLTFISNNTVNPNVPSETGFSVGNEVRIARKRFDRDSSDHSGSSVPNPRSRFIPVRLDDVPPPAAVAEFQWVDLFDPKGLKSLIEGIRRIWNSQGGPGY